MVLFIVSAVLAVFALGFGIYLSVQFVKNRIPPIPFNKLIKRIFIVIGVFTLSFATMMISIYLWGKLTPKPYELTAAIVGGLLVGFLGSVSLFSFIFHYWGGGEEKGISKDFDKWMFKALMAAFPLFLISIFFLTDGFARFVQYPLPNGISFTDGIVSPGHGCRPVSDSTIWLIMFVMRRRVFSSPTISNGCDKFCFNPPSSQTGIDCSKLCFIPDTSYCPFTKFLFA